MRAIVFSFLRTYRLPLIAVALAVVHSLLFWSYGPRVPLGLCIIAVMVSAWQGGMRSSLIATGLSIIVLGVISHFQSPGPMDDLILRLILFTIVGLIAGYLSQQCRHAIHAVDHVHNLLGGSGIAIIATDGTGQVASLNPLARTMSGVGEADVHGRPLDQVFRVIHGSTRQPLALPVTGTAQDLPEDALLVGDDGSETKVEGTIAPISMDAAKPAGVMIVFRQANGRSQQWEQLTQRAERFRALAGYAPAGLMVLDPQGRCVFSNASVQSACGCTEEECLGEGWSRHVQPQDRDHLISEWLQAVVGKQPFAAEFRVVSEAISRWLRVRSTPMLADNGEVLGHVAALEDVTDRKKAEDALADARRESEEQLQEWAAAEKKAQDDLRQLQEQLEDHGNTIRQGDETLQATRTDAEQKLRTEAGRRQKVEKELQDLRGQLETMQQAQQKLQATLKEKDRTAESLRGELARHQRDAEEARAALDEHQAALSEKGGAEETLRNELARHQREAAEARAALEQHQTALAQKGESVEALRNELARHQREAEEARAALDEHRAALAQKGGSEEALRNELARHQREAAEARDALDQHRTALAQKGSTEETLRQEMDRLAKDADALRQSHDRLQSLLAQKNGNEGALRQELERLAQEAEETRQAHDRLQVALAEKQKTEQTLRKELERLMGESSARQQAEETHERLRSLLSEKDQREESLRRQLDEAHGRHQVALAEKGKTEEALRQELERLQGKAAARRQAEATHERLRSLVTEKEEREETLRRQMDEVHGRHQAALAERQQREEALRREKEFLEGVIDGSPAGIFAHDRDGRCRVWNAALERLLGRSRRDAFGRTAAELFPPSDKTSASAMPAKNGTAARMRWRTGGIIGRSETLESIPATVRGASGEVIGGMTLVRVLPTTAPTGETDEAAAQMTAAHVGDRNWLDFN